VQDIDPSFTLGKLALSKEQILRELVSRGVADRNRSLGLPVPALRIGVLTSPDADGWSDFLRHLEDSAGGFAVTLHPIRVQGVELKPTLLRGLAWFADRAQDFDVLCILRGGGSRTDLAWFDDRDVAFATAQHPLKILIGIGHQRDQSVLDAIAHSAKTPTAVAELLVRGIESARTAVHEQAERLHDAIADLLADERHRLAVNARAIAHAAGRQLTSSRTALATAGRELASRTGLRLAGERSELRHTTLRLDRGAVRRLEQRRTALDHAETRRRLLDPARVLLRGYVVVRTADGRITPSVERLAPAQHVRLQFRDGQADAHVDQVQRNPS
jgi:exodeoxyribonuclease VII large subunit